MLTNDREPTEKDLVEGILGGGGQRESAWYFITKTWGSTSASVAMQRTNCNELQAKEAFSSACVGVDNRIRNAGGAVFLLTASLKTYLTQATVHAAFAIMRKQPRTEELLPSAMGGSDVDHFQLFYSEQCREIMDAALGSLGIRCKTILLLFANSYSMEEIGKQMGFENPDVARREKYKCQERFKTYLRENPAVRRQLVENCYG